MQVAIAVFMLWPTRHRESPGGLVESSEVLTRPSTTQKEEQKVRCNRVD